MSFDYLHNPNLLTVTFLFLIFFILVKKYSEKLIKGITKNILVIALLTTAALTVLYRSSAQIDTTSLGGPDSFGQFGDFIGGLLNPIFGFITVLLLIETLNTQRKELDEYKNNDTREKLEKLLQQAKDDLSKIMKAEVLANRDQYNLFSISSIKFPTKEEFNKPEHNSNRNFYKKLLEDVRNFNPSEYADPWFTNSNEMQLFSIQKSADDIINIYKEIIRLSHSEILKNWHYKNARRFLEGLQINSLFKSDNIQEKLDSLSVLVPDLPSDSKKISKWE